MSEPKLSKQALFWYACREGYLTWAMELCKDPEVLVWLGDPKRADRCALHLACEKNQLHIVRYLLTRPGMDVNRRIMGGEGYSPLNLTHLGPTYDLLLRDVRTDLGSGTHWGNMTELWYVCRGGDLDKVMRLIATGKRLHPLQKTGPQVHPYPNTTPLEMAMMRRQNDIVSMLQAYLLRPRHVTKQVRKKIDWTTPAALLFAQIVLLENQYTACRMSK